MDWPHNVNFLLASISYVYTMPNIIEIVDTSPFFAYNRNI